MCFVYHDLEITHGVSKPPWVLGVSNDYYCLLTKGWFNLWFNTCVVLLMLCTLSRALWKPRFSVQRAALQLQLVRGRWCRRLTP